MVSAKKRARYPRVDGLAGYIDDIISGKGQLEVISAGSISGIVVDVEDRTTINADRVYPVVLSRDGQEAYVILDPIGFEEKLPAEIVLVRYNTGNPKFADTGVPVVGGIAVRKDHIGVGYSIPDMYLSQKAHALVNSLSKRKKIGRNTIGTAIRQSYDSDKAARQICPNFADYKQQMLSRARGMADGGLKLQLDHNFNKYAHTHQRAL